VKRSRVKHAWPAGCWLDSTAQLQNILAESVLRQNLCEGVICLCVGLRLLLLLLHAHETDVRARSRC
jgi:hypothetical protein